MKDEEEPPNLYEELERRALFDLPDEEDEARPPDVIGAYTGTTEEAIARDVTLGGYIEKHDRVPAFEGSDGQPYTVDVDVAEGDVERQYAAFLIFIRWAATGAGIMDHVESGDIAYGASEQEARQAALELSLYEVKAELDAAIARRREALGD
jgi:hypothetical protein